MVGEKTLTNFVSGTQGLKSDFSTKPEKDMASNKEGFPPTVPSPPILGVMDPAFMADQNLYYPPNNCYGYYYPGFDGFPPLDDQGYLSTGVPSDNGSPMYYLPGYNPFAPGIMVPDREHSYIPSGFQPSGLYRPETYSRDSVCALDGDKVAKKSDKLKPVLGQYGSVKSNGYDASKTLNSSFGKPSDWTLNSNAQEFAFVPKSLSQTQRFGSMYKSGCGFQFSDNLNGVYPAGKYPPFSHQNQGPYMQYGSMNYQPNRRLWNGNQKFRSRYNYRQDGYNEASVEITRGPRANSKEDQPKSSLEDGQQEQNVGTDTYNLEDFQTEYDNAKFYVIKSYSEDDVHKSIKYAVWSSTPKGNKKLDVAFREADTKATEEGNKYPVFLFFSVNGSGQFVGVAEMTGPVDFNQNMDFWQVDKWSGFFPVKWHIVKDLPNHLFRHIILENNESRAVTHSRDTQEVGLKQGLEMLSICKNYSAKTSLLSDFNFYENREKSLKAKRHCKPVSETAEFTKLVNGVDRVTEEESKTNISNSVPSLVDLTNNLTLEEQVMKPITC